MTEEELLQVLNALDESDVDDFDYDDDEPDMIPCSRDTIEWDDDTDDDPDYCPGQSISTSGSEDQESEPPAPKRVSKKIIFTYSLWLLNNSCITCNIKILTSKLTKSFSFSEKIIRNKKRFKNQTKIHRRQPVLERWII